MRAGEEPRKIVTGTEHGGNPGNRLAKNLGFLLWCGGHGEPVGTKAAFPGPYPIPTNKPILRMRPPTLRF